MSRIRKKVFHMFGSIGGGARGFKRARAKVGSLEGEWQCVGSIDVDAAANRDFANLIGTPATTLDLADRDQYRAINGREPPEGWREAMPDDIRRAAGGHRPDCVFLSAPCKGFSGLLSEAKSRTDKYQAMNHLTVRGVWLMLEAWRDDPVPIVLFENVPRLLTRGRHLADQISAMFRSYGYAVSETVHDCGEIGGLAQSRKRCLIVARHIEKIPNFLYEPPKRPLRAVGDVLGKMLMPGDFAAGPMHRVPNLQWKTWVRLAFVEAGSDWRSLNKLAVEDGQLRDYLLVPEMHRGGYGVRDWKDSCGVVQGQSRPSNGAFSVADPRVDQSTQWNHGQHYGVHGWDRPSGAVTGQQYPNQGRFSVADPRTENSEFHGFRIVRWDRNSGTITGARAPGSSAQAVADPRCESTKHNNCFRVVGNDQPAGTVTAGGHPSAGGQAVADPRGPARDKMFGKYHCADWGGVSRTVISGDDNGAYGVADPRCGTAYAGKGKYIVTPFDEPSNTVIGASTTGQGAFAVADPRSGLDAARGSYLTGGHYGVLPWDGTAGAVPSSASYDNGPWSVADPRMPDATQKLVAVIRSLDGTWHRPFTTLELAALQSLFDPEDPAEVAAFTLDGVSDSAHRERIGNAVPSAAAEGMAAEILRTLLLADAGETFQLSAAPVWVRPLAASLNLAQGGQA